MKQQRKAIEEEIDHFLQSLVVLERRKYDIISKNEKDSIDDVSTSYTTPFLSK